MDDEHVHDQAALIAFRAQLERGYEGGGVKAAWDLADRFMGERAKRRKVEGGSDK